MSISTSGLLTCLSVSLFYTPSHSPSIAPAIYLYFSNTHTLSFSYFLTLHLILFVSFPPFFSLPPSLPPSLPLRVCFLICLSASFFLFFSLIFSLSALSFCFFLSLTVYLSLPLSSFLSLSDPRFIFLFVTLLYFSPSLSFYLSLCVSLSSLSFSYFLYLSSSLSLCLSISHTHSFTHSHYESVVICTDHIFLFSSLLTFFKFKVRSNAYPSSHWIGTAQMGNNRKKSVVTERLCVWGVQNLRVAGAI